MKRHALFVGVDQYADEEIQDLRCAVNDATELAGFFKHRALFDRAEAVANPRNCEAVLDRVRDMLAGLGAGDEFLFFFAGHGVKTQDGHRLVCAGDRLAAVKHSWAGLPLERLRFETGGVFNRLFLLDACRTDVHATNRGVAGVMEEGARDVILEGAGTADAAGEGALTILCSCDDGESAGECLQLHHGLFSMAMLELLVEEHKCGRQVLADDDFVYKRLPGRMRALAEKSDMTFCQKPQKRGPPVLILDGRVMAPDMRFAGTGRVQAPAAPTLVVCPLCGKKNRAEDTFRCHECGRDNLCLRHQDEETYLCTGCAGERKRKAEAERDRLARERAEAEERRRQEEKEREATVGTKAGGGDGRKRPLYDPRCRLEPRNEKERRRMGRILAAYGLTWEEAKRIEDEKFGPREEASRRAGDTKTLTLPGGASMEMVWCPPGAFMMGSPKGEEWRHDDETQHQVTLTKGFWLGKYPVTQAQWRSVMGNNPSHFKGDDLPVEWVSWVDCQAFCKKAGLCLPTEAQWEYACRAGSTGPYAGTGRLADMGWFEENSAGWGFFASRKTHPVGQKRANAWGLHDMHGNVWEWCADWYGDYPGGGVTDPTGPQTGSYRVYRGGSWCNSAMNCRSAERGRNDPRDCGVLGLRVALLSVQ